MPAITTNLIYKHKSIIKKSLKVSKKDWKNCQSSSDVSSTTGQQMAQNVSVGLPEIFAINNPKFFKKKTHCKVANMAVVDNTLRVNNEVSCHKQCGALGFDISFVT